MSNMSTGYMTAEQHSITNHICVLPVGDFLNKEMGNWSTEELKYCQYYFENGQPLDTFFRSYIFDPIRIRDDYYIHAMHTGLGKQARISDWMLVTDHLFDENVNLHALAQNTNEGEVNEVWVTIPYPHPLQENFGTVLEEKLDFTNDEDRLKAIKWWIECFLIRWQKEEGLHQKLAFKGFVWQRSSINTGDEQIVKDTNDYIHQKGYLTLWLFNFGSPGCAQWDTLNFDAACANPNYYGNTEVDTNWIKNTTVFSQYYHTGIQISFGTGMLFNNTHLYDYLNFGVSEGYMMNSLIAFQFPNQTLKKIYLNHPDEYKNMYLFTKKQYEPIQQ
ncbi:DUF4855 domain-containing protein [Heyndrickxia sp. FSL K6-6286]|uniref:DUF4855 domain-containing protein n=1 Tax=Heyndrickxia sp. FSL K6-6286 TaxID=2921510 RepID=UPI00315AEE8D